jgi:hypothetical protein
MHILNVTGYRKRDVLWSAVPIVGTIVETKSMWRYTAREVYWNGRHDRPSDVLHGWARPVAIAGGWLMVPAFAVGGAIAVATDDDFGCVADDVQETMDAQDDFSFGNLGDAIDGALERCDVDIDFDGDADPDPELGETPAG